MPPKKPVSKAPVKPSTTKTGGVKGPANKSNQAAKKPSAAEDDQKAVNLPSVVDVTLRQIDSVLLKDVDNKIQQSGKWPLIIDEGGQVSTFLKYRDANCLNALEKDDMEPERIRMSILGALRFGKPVVLDMMAAADMFDTCSALFNKVKEGLMDNIMDQSILKEENYTTLIKSSDGDEYNGFGYQPENFRFFIITQNPSPPESLMKRIYPIRIVSPE